MLQVARLAPKSLGESAPLVRGLFPRPSSAPTADSATAGAEATSTTPFSDWKDWPHSGRKFPLERVEPFLRSYGDGEGLDLVHQACLARCWASFPPACRPAWGSDRLLARIEGHRSADGGYDLQPGASQGSLYGCFLALGTYQDVGTGMPGPRRMLECIERLRHGRRRLHEPCRYAARPDAGDRGGGGLAAATRCRAGTCAWDSGCSAAAGLKAGSSPAPWPPCPTCFPRQPHSTPWTRWTSICEARGRTLPRFSRQPLDQSRRLLRFLGR